MNELHPEPQHKDSSNCPYFESLRGPHGVNKSCAWISLLNFWISIHLRNNPFWSCTDLLKLVELPPTPYWFYFHSRCSRILLGKQSPIFLPAFLSFHSYPFFPLHSLRFHYFFISFSDLSMPFILHNMEQDGVERKEQFLIVKAGTFSLSHMEIFCPPVCKHRGAPFLHCSLPSMVLGTFGSWVDWICLSGWVRVC